MTPNTEQIGALKAWSELHGRNWKAALRNAWMTGNYDGFDASHLLQQVRNTFGPTWLVRFSFTKVLGVRAVAGGNLRSRVKNPVQHPEGQGEVRTLRLQEEGCL